MKIRKLELKNIGVFEDMTISFPEKKGKDLAVSTGAEIHILTGQNGTGKTTILQALANSMFKIDPFDEDEFAYIESLNKTLKSFKKKFKLKESKAKINFNINEPVILDSSIRIIVNRLEKKSDGSLIEILLNNINELINYSFNFSSFAYSGYRFVEHQENINIKEPTNYNPLENALEFNKGDDKNDYTLNQWLANTIAKRNSAFFDGIQEKVEKYSRNIDFLKQIIQDIIEIPVDFKYKTETSKIVAVKNGQELDFDILPDGLRSIISWLGDLIMRMDALKWENDLPIQEREFILFLDEIEVHLHPYWQRKILPVVQKTFKNAQIFITTHSPFIVNSVDGAYIYELDLDSKGNSKVTKIRESNTADSYQTVIREVFETERFSETFEDELKLFATMRNDILLHKNIDDKAFLDKAAELANRNDEVKNTILFELRQLSNKTGKKFAI